MKTRHSIITISILFLILAIVFFYGFKNATDSKKNILLLNRYTELKKSIGTLFETNNRSFENYILENTYDQDLKKAIAKKDTNWLTSNLISNLSNNEIDCVWIFTKEGEVLFNNKENNKSFPFEKNTFLNSLTESPYKIFYANIEGTITQFTTAPMELNSNDVNTVYLAFGKKYDSVYLNKIDNIAAGANFSILQKSNPLLDSIDNKSNIINYNFKLLDFQGNEIANLQSSKTLQEITIYNDYFEKNSLIYLSLFLLLGFAYYKFIGLKILKPISILSDALNKRDNSFLKKLTKKNNEFGSIAILIDESFSNIKKLHNEIEVRKIAENNLKSTAIDLEKATIEKVKAELDKKAKGDFLSTMSHEIRTPINGVIGIANLLQSEQLNPEQKDLVSTLVFSSNYLLSILTDILDFSKIESGNLDFDSVQFNLKDICNKIQALNNANANNKNLNLIFCDDENVSEYLNGDSLRLCQVLNNLIGNAIKFTQSGSVTFGYRLVKTNNNKQTIEFTVKDTGIGIAEDKLDSIFDSFSQANSSINTNYGGTGLGLTISKKLIELQGGNIKVKSKLNEGTTFTFLLHFDEVNTAQHQEEAKGKINNILNLNGLNVLVAEDNNINAMILQKFLEKWNVKLDFVINGKAALEKLYENEYDLILMDLHMPIMGGAEATKEIRSNKNTIINSIPIVALTADATSETQKLMLSSGFDAYITKPFNPEKLYSILEKYSLN